MTLEITVKHRSFERLHAEALDGALVLHAARTAPMQWQHALTLDGTPISPKNDEIFYKFVRKHLTLLPRGASVFSTAYLRAFSGLANAVVSARAEVAAKRAETPFPTVPLQGATMSMTGTKQP